MMRAKTEDLRAATIVQARSGCPPTGTRFLRGIPLEPPLAGMKPRTLGRAFAVATPESREGPATMRLDRASPAQLHRTAQLRAQARVFLLPHGEFSPARYTWQIFSQCCLSQSCRVHARLDCRIYATTLRAYSGLCRSLALPKVGSGLPIKNRGCRRARGRRCRARASIATTAPSERCHRGSGEERRRGRLFGTGNATLSGRVRVFRARTALRAARPLRRRPARSGVQTDNPSIFHPPRRRPRRPPPRARFVTHLTSSQALPRAVDAEREGAGLRRRAATDGIGDGVA